jgi:hypothetical protein
MSKFRKRLNKHEKELLVNQDIMRGVFVVLLVLNFVLPILSPTGIGIGSIFQWAIVLIHFYGLLNGLGQILGQKVPLVAVALVRIAQVVWYQLIPIGFTSLNWPIFTIVLIIDFLFVLVLYLDKSRYYYEAM